VNYGDDDPDRLRRAQALLAQHDWLERASIHTIAATGEVDAARELLGRDPSHASLVGGPHGWEPLLYLTYARVPLGPGRSAVAVARLLLEHGADPNAGYLWEGLIPPFTALTGALGGGGTIPKHQEELALARLLLQAGADANDGQALYNQGWGPHPGEDWLELLFEFGLGTGDGGPWRRRLGERQDSPRTMVEDLLIAADPGLRERAIERCPDQLGRAAEQDSYEGVAVLIELGFDVNAWSRTAALHEAAMRGNLPVIRLLLDHGADPNIHDTSYDATPSGWAEHHGQPEAHQLLEALEQPAPPRPRPRPRPMPRRVRSRRRSREPRCGP
jgi:hypothetical protein